MRDMNEKMFAVIICKAYTKDPQVSMSARREGFAGARGRLVAAKTRRRHESPDIQRVYRRMEAGLRDPDQNPGSLIADSGNVSLLR